MQPEMHAARLTRRELLAWFGRAAVLVGMPTIVTAASAGDSSVAGYGGDPNLLDPQRPWTLTLSATQREAIERLADLLLPGDEHGPAPSRIGIAEFIDEWISAPYPQQREDRELILEGLEALPNGADSTLPETEPFFTTFRRVCVLGYYTSPAGLADIGCVVPAPAADFPGPPDAVRRRLGV